MHPDADPAGLLQLHQSGTSPTVGGAAFGVYAVGIVRG